MKNLILILISVFVTLSTVQSQDVFEKSGTLFTYKLNKFKFLIIAYDGCSYEETVLVADQWKAWGGTIEIAANANIITATTAKKNNEFGVASTAQIKADLLIPQVNPDMYDVIYIVGGHNYKLLIDQYGNDIKRILFGAYNKGKIVSTFCHSSAVLSICDFIRGRNVTVDGFDERKLLVNAGAIINNDIVVCDKNIITGRFPYCETFASFIAEKLQYPKGNGPYTASAKNSNKMVGFIQHMGSSQIFAKKPLPKDTLDIILKTGMKSQMSENYTFNKVIRFVCITDTLILNRMKDSLIANNIKNFATRSHPKEYSKWYINAMMENSPAIVLVYNDNSAIDTIQNGKLRKLQEFKYASYSGASCQNMLLASKALGVGGKLGNPEWFAEIDHQLKIMLNLPEKYTLIGSVILGYSIFDGVPPISRPLENFTSYK